ncbi:hypothetical protein [Blastochloris viridis]|nr:hypothetical protein [Blastochloris viridis]BAR98152.1 hypothetical protein BV133_559 [Blastochloris viridis]
MGLAALAALAASALAACSPSVAGIPYAVDRSVIVEASPADPSPIERHYSGALPSCGDPWALSRIMLFFAEKEQHFWASPLAIQGFSDLREVAYRPWGYGKIPRRYCQAVAHVNDGRPRTVYYSIIENGGFAGFGTGVEWCVKGLDRDWTYAPDCRMARP